MALSWLALCQRVSDELGAARPTLIAGAQDTNARQLGALANRCGDMLLRMQGWTFLQSPWTITTTAPVVLTGNTTSGSAIITGLSSTSSLAATTWVVSASGFVQQPRIKSIDSASQVTLDTKATSTLTATTLTFAQDTYALPSDFLSFCDETGWDRTRRWQMLGPTSPSEDAALRSGIIAPVPRTRWRQVGRPSNNFRLWPPPTSVTAPSTLVFDYQSSYWATSAAGSPQSAFAADADTCVFADDIMAVGIKWLWLQAKGFDFETYRADWAAMAANASAVDGGAADLSLTRKTMWDPLDPAAVNVTGTAGITLGTGTLG
jgi:hypothetical protein